MTQAEHITLKAVTTARDQGLVEAVISSENPDRELDVVDPAAMVRALQKWTPTGKRIPRAWNHSGDPDKQIGYVEPSSAKVVGNEVRVDGYLDQDTTVGAHAWRLVKAGTLGFSFGYLVPDGGSTRRKGGGRNITALEIFELTATPTPANNDTRVLSYKAAALQFTGRVLTSEDDLRARAQQRVVSDDASRRRAHAVVMDFERGRTGVERRAATRAEAREEKARLQRSDERRREMSALIVEDAVGDPDLIRKAKAKAQRSATLTTCQGSSSAMDDALIKALNGLGRTRP
jgi:HK97 family phage prohead protease